MVPSVMHGYSIQASLIISTITTMELMFKEAVGNETSASRVPAREQGVSPRSNKSHYLITLYAFKSTRLR